MENTISNSTCYFSHLPVEILQIITGYLSFELKNLLDLYEAFPSVFPFLKCFKNIHNAGIAEYYTEVDLHKDAPTMTPQLLESIMQSDPKIINIHCSRIGFHTQFRTRAQISVYLQDEQITSSDMTQISLALQSPHNNITRILFCNNGHCLDPLFVKLFEHRHNRVHTFRFTDNKIKSQGAQALANALTHPHCKIINLELWFNRIGYNERVLLERAVETVRKSKALTLTYE